MILKTNCRKILFLLLISPVTFAAAKEHRHHEAHVHGSATLNIAFEKLQGKIEFKAAADSILGFEHEAKSEKDKKTVSDISSLFENNINTMVQLDPALGCKISTEKIANQLQGKHSDFIANFNVLCKKEIIGSKMTIDFTRFKTLKDIDVTLLADTVQKTAEVKSKPITLDVK